MKLLQGKIQELLEKMQDEDITKVRNYSFMQHKLADGLVTGLITSNVEKLV